MKENIGIYTTQETFDHKMVSCEAYWTLPWRGKQSLEEMGDGGSTTPIKLWVACNGYWQGYFPIDRIEGNDLIFSGRDWIQIPQPVPRKPFQGFTYKVPNSNL